MATRLTWFGSSWPLRPERRNLGVCGQRQCWKCFKPQLIALKWFTSKGAGVKYCGLSADCGSGADRSLTRRQSGVRASPPFVEVSDFTDEPHKVHILTEPCRVTDMVAELDEAAAEAPLTVKGSVGQQVISPFIAEARAQRALLAQLLGRLSLPETDEAQAEAAAKLHRTRHDKAKVKRR